MTKELLVRTRLGLETDLAIPNEQKGMDDSITSMLERELDNVKEQMVKLGISEDEYKSMSEEYLRQKYNEVKDQKWFNIHYTFVGIGSYDVTLPEDQIECFNAYIAGNGGAFADKPVEADQADIMRALALHANDGISMGIK